MTPIHQESNSHEIITAVYIVAKVYVIQTEIHILLLQSHSFLSQSMRYKSIVINLLKFNIKQLIFLKKVYFESLHLFHN